MKKTFSLFLLMFIHFCTFSQSMNNGINSMAICKNAKGKLTEKAVKNNTVDSLITLCLSEINKDSLESTIQHLQDFGTRFMLAPNHKEIALWLQNKFISLGYTNTVLDSFISVSYIPGFPVNDTTMQYNVIATWSGNVNANNVYVIGGHYDDMSNADPMTNAPGADDNASGIGAIIEVARSMKKIGYSPASTIKFVAFATEESQINYSQEWGSKHYVEDAIMNNENIIFFIANDMISNCIDSTLFTLLYRNSSKWTVQLADEICQNYTYLTSVHIFQDSAGADDYAFSLAGIPAIWLYENQFTPYYHSAGDTIGNYNMAYCAEISKVSAGMLIHSSESPLVVKDFFIINPGDGHSLQPSWSPNNELDLAGYKVYIGQSPGAYDTVIITTDTSYIFNNLTSDTTYYFGVTAINNKGIESLIVEKSDAPGLVTLSEGILIVKDSRGTLLNPPEQQVDDFYDQICQGFVHSQYDATATNKISLGIIGKFSTLLWHMDNMNWSSSIMSNYSDVLRNYLNLGGQILFTTYRPSKFFVNNTDQPFCFNKGSFLYDCANIEGVNNRFGTRFSGAIPVLQDVDSIFVDSTKAPPTLSYNYQLPNIEAFSPSPNGNILYLFDSGYDSTTVQGSFIGRPVAVENSSPDKKIITLSFPLYYMNADQAKDFVNHVMVDKFHENYSNIKEAELEENHDLIVYPNPATKQITISCAEEQQLNVSIYNIVGEIVLQRILDPLNRGVNISFLEAGMYILKVTSAGWTIQKKIIKE